MNPNKMSNKSRLIKTLSSLLPIATFALAFSIHFLWFVYFPEQDQAQVKWASIPDETTSFQRYIESDNYWFGYTYGICFAFITIALKNYIKNRCSTTRSFALGGMTLTGFWAVAACFLIGCCGSPMMVVWLNIFGAQFLPFAKPMVAGLTTLSLIGAWIYMNRKFNSNNCG